MTVPDLVSLDGADQIGSKEFERGLAALLCSHGTDSDQTVPAVDAGARTRLPAEGSVIQKLSAAAHTVIAARRSQLARAEVALVLTDEAGSLLRSWVADDASRLRLESMGLLDGADVDVVVPGRSGFSCLLARHPVLVVGSEHSDARLSELGTAGSLIAHPSSRRVIGSLTLVGPSSQVTPLALSWVRELVDEVQEVYADPHSRADRAVMARYLRDIHDSRHALIVMNERTILSNAAAARLIGVEEQTVLWEHANQVLVGSLPPESTLHLGHERTLHVKCEAVNDGDTLVGVVLRLRRVHVRTSNDPPPSLPGLVGDSPAWRAAMSQLAGSGALPILLVGERGTGKTAIARALYHDRLMLVVDGHDTGSVLAKALDKLSSMPKRRTSAVLLRRVDLMSEPDRTHIARLVAAHASTTRFIATMRDDASLSLAGEPFMDHFARVVRVPPLRERPEDLPLLVRALTESHIERHPGLRPCSWMTDALQALRRVEWPGNVATLQSVVSLVVDASRTGYISARDLPPELLTRTSRRQLDRLATAEVHAILGALREVDGNKAQAADRLGIARSTLYRKMRSLGIDLSSTTY